MSGFFEELKRRKVYRVAAAYIVAGGFIIQIASAVFPAWELPNWSQRLMIALILAGFPIALIFAWIFDVTPSGIERTSRVVPQAMPKSRRRRNLILLAVGGLAISVAAGFLILPRAAARKIDKSIAVLPFENLSADKENAYFADGIQDDVLTNLSKIADLKVISRTSVMSYRGSSRNVRDIGKALGVSTILEGSVRRSGNRVRVNVQLINATNDEHIWANDYDRDMTDVFAIQTDLAHEIAGELQLRLSPTERILVDRKPTQNNEAHLLYVRAHSFEGRPDETEDTLNQGEQLLEKAIALDHSFALAYALLSRLESHVYHEREPIAARIDKARAAAAEAIRLQPDLPEAHLALGACYYYGDRNYERALQEYAIAERGLPNNATVNMSIAAIERRQGKWAESIAHWTKAATLDPNNANLWSELTNTYAALRNFPAAIKAADRALEVAPASPILRIYRAMLSIDANGDANEAEKFLAQIPATPDPEGHIVEARAIVRVNQKKYNDAMQLLLHSPQEKFTSEIGAPVPKTFFIGLLYQAQKDYAKARSAFESARPALEASVAKTPALPGPHIVLGQLYAGLGRKEDAIREGKRAVEVLPESIDAFEGPTALAGQAEIYGMLGDANAAIPILEHLLSSPVGIPVQRLRTDFYWDPIRNDPRFHALIDKYSAKK